MTRADKSVIPDAAKPRSGIALKTKLGVIFAPEGRSRVFLATIPAVRCAAAGMTAADGGDA